MSTFPIDLGAYQRISLDPSVSTLSAEQKAALEAELRPYLTIQLHRGKNYDLHKCIDVITQDQMVGFA